MSATIFMAMINAITNGWIVKHHSSTGLTFSTSFAYDTIAMHDSQNTRPPISTLFTKKNGIKVHFLHNFVPTKINAKTDKNKPIMHIKIITVKLANIDVV